MASPSPEGRQGHVRLPLREHGWRGAGRAHPAGRDCWDSFVLREPPWCQPRPDCPHEEERPSPHPGWSLGDGLVGGLKRRSAGPVHPPEGPCKEAALAGVCMGPEHVDQVTRRVGTGLLRGEQVTRPRQGQRLARRPGSIALQIAWRTEGEHRGGWGTGLLSTEGGESPAAGQVDRPLASRESPQTDHRHPPDRRTRWPPSRGQWAHTDHGCHL